MHINTTQSMLLFTRHFRESEMGKDCERTGKKKETIFITLNRETMKGRVTEGVGVKPERKKESRRLGANEHSGIEVREKEVEV